MSVFNDCLFPIICMILRLFLYRNLNLHSQFWWYMFLRRVRHLRLDSFVIIFNICLFAYTKLSFRTCLSHVGFTRFYYKFSFALSFALYFAFSFAFSFVFFSGWGLGAFLMWWPPSAMWAGPLIFLWPPPGMSEWSHHFELGIMCCMLSMFHVSRIVANISKPSLPFAQ